MSDDFRTAELINTEGDNFEERLPPFHADIDLALRLWTVRRNCRNYCTAFLICHYVAVAVNANNNGIWAFPLDLDAVSNGNCVAFLILKADWFLVKLGSLNLNFFPNGIEGIGFGAYILSNPALFKIPIWAVAVNLLFVVLFADCRFGLPACRVCKPCIVAVSLNCPADKLISASLNRAVWNGKSVSECNIKCGCVSGTAVTVKLNRQSRILSRKRLNISSTIMLIRRRTIWRWTTFTSALNRLTANR